jgi:hypothetical protein
MTKMRAWTMVVPLYIIVITSKIVRVRFDVYMTKHHKLMILMQKQLLDHINIRSIG